MAAQIPDIIIFEGREMDLYSNPLEQYWVVQKKIRPNFRLSPDCMRGYIATWAIIDNELYIKNIEGEIRESSVLFGTNIINCSLKKLFRKTTKDGVKAVWFTGKLRIPIGNMTRFYDSNYDSRFEKEIILSLDKGKVIKTVTLDNSHQKLIVNH